MKNIAIIGGHGFIGKNLSAFFAKKAFNTSVIGRNSQNATFPVEITSIDADIQDTKKLLEATKNADVVIWLASSLVPGTHEASLELDFETNIKPVISFLENSAINTLKKFIYLSSGGTVYGDTEQNMPIDENQSKAPISEYGLSKLVTENYIHFLTKQATFESFILRPSNVYGKYQNLQKPQGIIGFAFKSLIDDTSIDLYNDGKVIRDFVSVHDLAEAVLKCIEKPVQFAKVHTYNVGSGIPFSIKEIIDRISETASTKVKTNAKQSRSFDCAYNVLNIKKIEQELGWKPNVIIDQGLLEVWEWIKNERYGK